MSIAPRTRSLRTAPPLSKTNVMWWRQMYGDGGDNTSKAVIPDLDGFYRAVRDNQVDQVQRFIAKHPAAVFTKRTALYVASLFGRHQIVKLLLRRGADKDLLCDGVRAIDVAGFASVDLVDRMKVRALLQGDACPQVIVRLVATGSSAANKSAASEMRRVEVHFSEPVDEFTQEDIVCSGGCVVTAFSMLRSDLYLVTVRLARGGGSVQVPAGAARGRCALNAESRPFHLGRE
ncbi:hypothetical protein PR001_g20 [Phytophthora rubi]|uniref:Uncharacterized protein n=1 Tax=Phytophthora rubi TaxID=129364 RepID=A0A6A3P4I1_9STRA|nr:hypothetical protein PR001_g20 [Phytophthora rubi]